jgi:hypothetical protein
VKRILPTLEHHTEPVLPLRHFAWRLVRSTAVALVLIWLSLLAGMLGYHGFEGLSWLDAFVNAAMLLGGMGPVFNPVTEAGKLFAGCYALYCGLAVILVAGLILTPVAHRVLHKFHVEDRER